MWLLPSYKRPEGCRKLLKAFVETGATTPGVLMVQGSQDGYEGIELPYGWIRQDLPENIGLAGAMAKIFADFPDEPWYGLLSDDIVPIEPHAWDWVLVEAAGSKHIAHGSDGWQSGERCHGIPVLGGDLVRALGDWSVPGTWHCFADDLWEEAARDFGLRRYMPEVKSHGDHFLAGTAPKDETYTKAYEFMGDDEAAWNAWLKSDEKKQAWGRVSDLMDKTPKRTTDLSGNSVAICTPSIHARPVGRYTVSLFASQILNFKLGIGCGLYMLDKCSILPYARNRLTREFLLSKATHMLFVDDDMGWDDNAIPELLAHDKDVIAAVGITKDEDPDQRRFCVEMDPEVTKYDAQRGIIRVPKVGTGFMLIKRHVLEKMWARYADKQTPCPPEAPHLGPIHWVFDYDIGNPDGWGEDYNFCRRWREMGGEVWIDPSIRLDHVGEFSYSGTYADWLREQHGRTEAA